MGGACGLPDAELISLGIETPDPTMVTRICKSYMEGFFSVPAWPKKTFE